MSLFGISLPLPSLPAPTINIPNPTSILTQATKTITGGYTFPTTPSTKPSSTPIISLPTPQININTPSLPTVIQNLGTGKNLPSIAQQTIQQVQQGYSNLGTGNNLKNVVASLGTGGNLPPVLQKVLSTPSTQQNTSNGNPVNNNPYTGPTVTPDSNTGTWHPSIFTKTQNDILTAQNNAYTMFHTPSVSTDNTSGNGTGHPNAQGNTQTGDTSGQGNQTPVYNIYYQGTGWDTGNSGMPTYPGGGGAQTPTGQYSGADWSTLLASGIAGTISNMSSPWLGAGSAIQSIGSGAGTGIGTIGQDIGGDMTVLAIIGAGVLLGGYFITKHM